jgi:hypothetical protein
LAMERSAEGRRLMERRKFRRFDVINGAFAVPEFRAGEGGRILDIGKGGLSYVYVEDTRRSSGAFTMDILLNNIGFYMEKIPVKTVADVAVLNKVPFSVLPTRRCCVEFQELTWHQESQIAHFIHKYTHSLY